MDAQEPLVIRYGLRRLFTALPGALLMTAPTGVLLWVVLSGRWEGSTSTWIAAVCLVLLGLLGAGTFAAVWKDRRVTVTFDATGVHWADRDRAAAIPWDSLAGAGVYWARRISGLPVRKHTLELCPAAEIGRDDPLLWPYVRDEEPLRPWLPRRRYRIALLPGTEDRVAAACERWAGEVWFGVERKEWGYAGAPDIKGHRERLRGAAGKDGR